MKPSRALVALALAGTLVASACSGSGGGGGGGGKDLGEIRVQQFPSQLFEATMNVALEEGYFDDLGLTVKTVNLDSTPAAVAAMTGGSVDLIPSNGDNLYVEVSKGVKLQAFAGASGENMVYVGRAKPGPYPAWVKQLKGHTIGVTAPGASSDLWIHALLKAAGVPASSVKFTSVTPVSALQLYKKGKLDGWAGTDPTASKFVAAGAHEIAHFGDGKGPEGKLPVQIMWQGLHKYIKDNPKKIEAFVKGLQRAAKFIKNPKNTKQVAADIAKVAQINVKTSVAGGQKGWVKMVADYRSRISVTGLTDEDLAAYLTYARKYEANLIKGSDFVKGNPVKINKKKDLVWDKAPKPTAGR